MNPGRSQAHPAAALVAAASFLFLAPAAARAVTQVPAGAGAAASEAENVDAVPAQASSPEIAVDVWVNREEGGVYRSGESMRIFFRTNSDAYVLVYNIDTEGFIHLVYPYGPSDPLRVEAGRTYRIPARHDPYDLVADGPPGMEFVVAVTSRHPFRDLPWFLRGGDPDEVRSDDELESGQIVGDPYVGIERLNQRIIAPEFADDSDVTETFFYIHQRVEYPRYVCADCHYAAYPMFDPYVAHCSVMDIRIDATWVRYARPRVGVVRPRYYYYVRPGAPDRYAEWKNRRWSSLDGAATLRTRFVVQGTPRTTRDRQSTQKRQLPPEFQDLRRARPGRLWQGRDEIIRLRERVPDVGSGKARGGERRPKGDDPRVAPRSTREKEKPSSPPKSESRERSREPDDATKGRAREDTGRKRSDDARSRDRSGADESREQERRAELERRQEEHRRWAREQRAEDDRRQEERRREEQVRRKEEPRRTEPARREQDESSARERSNQEKKVEQNRGNERNREVERPGWTRDHGRGRQRG
ncbi:MAG TPA: DUF4384 domain-containing protein [Candidatus Eisenbacteria bacterium]|nr:DUF4384 domain-containing protein [Candidatus Eisenbacteria bacterium]